MVLAIGRRLILSKAQKSAGTNGPNHAGGMLVESEMEVRSGAVGVIEFDAVDVSCGLIADVDHAEKRITSSTSTL